MSVPHLVAFDRKHSRIVRTTTAWRLQFLFNFIRFYSRRYPPASRSKTVQISSVFERHEVPDDLQKTIIRHIGYALGVNVDTENFRERH